MKIRMPNIFCYFHSNKRQCETSSIPSLGVWGQRNLQFVTKKGCLSWYQAYLKYSAMLIERNSAVSFKIDCSADCLLLLRAPLWGQLFSIRQWPHWKQNRIYPRRICKPGLQNLKAKLDLSAIICIVLEKSPASMISLQDGLHLFPLLPLPPWACLL